MNCTLNAGWYETGETVLLSLGVTAFFCLMMATAACGTWKGIRQSMLLLVILAVFLQVWIGDTVWATVAAIAAGWGLAAVIAATCGGVLYQTLGVKGYRVKLYAALWCTMAAFSAIVIMGAALAG